MAQETEIVFTPFNFDDPAKKAQIQYTTYCNKIINGTTTMADEETGFMFHQWPTFAPAKFIPNPEDRDFMKFSLNPAEKACVELEEKLNSYDNELRQARKQVFGKFDKLFPEENFIPSVKVPREKDDLDAEIDAGNSKPKEPKFNSARFKLDMGWRSYYNGERLDFTNSKIVQKGIKDAISSSKDKSIINTLSFTLKFKDENNKLTNRVVAMNEIEQRKEISTKVFYRRQDNIVPDAKIPVDCNEDELVKFYGEAEQQDVRSPDDFDKYYRPNSYVRIMYSPQKIWAMKNKDENGKRKFSIQWVCKQIDIIHIKTQSNTQTYTKSKYGQYAFGQTNSSGPVKQMLIKDDDSEKSGSKKAASVAATSSKTPTKSTKKVESEEEESEEEEEEEEEVVVTKGKKIETKPVAKTSSKSKEESEDEEVEESEEEDEEEEEEVVVTKGKKVVETKSAAKSSSKSTASTPARKK
jgi:hypothetical protein